MRTAVAPTYVVMAYMVMALRSALPYVVVALRSALPYIVMAYIVMVYIVIAYIFMACMVMALDRHCPAAFATRMLPRFPE